MCSKFVLLVLVSLSVTGALCQFPPFDENCETDKYVPEKLISAPTYTVNLDLAPEERWKEISTIYAQPVTDLVNYIKDFIVEFSPKLQALVNLIENDLGKFVDTLPAPYGDEIKGIANVTNIPLGDMALYNMFYEIFTLCTSIVGQDANGKMYHARNLDFGLFLGWDIKNDTWRLSELLRPLIINVNYTRGGELKYKTVTFVGFVGVITGVKPNHYSFSMNERFEADGGYIGLFEWFLGINRKQAWTTLLARDVFENDDLDFEKAVKIFSDTPLIAPCYYIFAGPKPDQGAVITRDRERAADVWRLGTGNDTWYLAETNYDHWTAPLFLDDRITPCNNCMHKWGQENLNFSMLFNVLSSKPVLNKLTVYSALMEVESGLVETYIQHCPSPCVPF